MIEKVAKQKDEANLFKVLTIQDRNNKIAEKHEMVNEQLNKKKRQQMKARNDRQKQIKQNLDTLNKSVSSSQMQMREDSLVRKQIQEENYKRVMEEKKAKQHAVIQKHLVNDVVREFKQCKEKPVIAVPVVHQKVPQQKRIGAEMKSIYKEQKYAEIEKRDSTKQESEQEIA